MTISMYDASVKSYQQAVNAMAALLEKCAGDCAGKGLAPDDLVSASLHDDMYPLHFQIVSVAHHSIGAINGMKAGEFTPPSGYGDMDYAGLQALILRTKEQLDALSEDTVNALGGGQTVFKFGEVALPFTNENFLLSFSLPNFYFHVTTAYDIFRHAGLSIGKRDYLGQMRIGV